MSTCGFENCPLCGSPKGHAPGCPYGGAVTEAAPGQEPERPYCETCGWWHAGGCG